MHKQKRSPEEIEALLNSLQQVETASPGPFFYTRLKAAMQREQQSIWTWLSRPAVAFACLFLLLGINGWVIYQQYTGTQENAQAQVSLDETAYAMNSFYDITPTDTNE
jgi:hypothetical protein